MKKTKISFLTLVFLSLITVAVFAEDGVIHGGGKCDPTQPGCSQGAVANPPASGDSSSETIAETVLRYLTELFK